QHAVDNYKPQIGEWLDGKRVDILLIPITTISESLPSVLIEIQNVVDKAYIHRLNQYCTGCPHDLYQKNAGRTMQKVFLQL
ncbi:hypothetical protein PS6_007157, partial [Mucor atramentarius]